MVVTSMQSVGYCLGEVEPQWEVTDVSHQGVKYLLQSRTVCGRGAKYNNYLRPLKQICLIKHYSGSVVWFQQAQQYNYTI